MPPRARPPKAAPAPEPQRVGIATDELGEAQAYAFAIFEQRVNALLLRDADLQKRAAWAAPGVVARCAWARARYAASYGDADPLLDAVISGI